MATLHNAICDHSLPHRLKAKRMAIADLSRNEIVSRSQTPTVILPDNQIGTPRTKTNDELLTDSKQMVTKLKENIAQDMTSLTSKDVTSIMNPPEIKVEPPARPKSPRMHIPVAIPEPVHHDSDIVFKVPVSPRGTNPSF